MVFRCKMCGAPLEVDGTQSVVVCEYCECSQTVQLPPEPKKKEESSNYFKEAREEKERKEREETEKRNLEKEREEYERKKREKEKEEYEEKKYKKEKEEYKKKKYEKDEDDDDNHDRKGGFAPWFKMLVFGFLFLTIAAFVLGVVVRNAAFKQAMEHKKAGEYREALELFLKAGVHDDAENQIEETLKLLSEKQKEEREPVMASGKYDYLKDAEIGDIITLGTYEQGKDNSTQHEPIEWKVLEKEDGRMLVISKDILNSIPVEELIKEWEENPARNWLISKFYEKVFSKEEKTLICDVINDTSNYYEGGVEKTVDTVFLLSDEEVEKYMKDNQDRFAEKTQYVSGKSMSDGWLLRNPVDRIEDGRSLSVGSIFFTVQVLPSGEIDYYVKNNSNKTFALRPAMWLAFD